MDYQAIWLSVRLAASTTAILLLVGVPLAYWISFSRRRWKFLVEAVVALPLVLPPTVLGFYVLLAIGPRSPVGALYARLTGGMLPFSFQGLLLASVLYSLPFTVQHVAAAFAGVTRTVSISIYDQVQSLDYGAATETSLFLLGVSFAVLAATYALQQIGRASLSGA